MIHGNDAVIVIVVVGVTIALDCHGVSNKERKGARADCFKFRKEESGKT